MLTQGAKSSWAAAALPCAAHELSCEFLCRSIARWLLTPTHVVVFFFFSGFVGFATLFCSFTYRALPAVNDATPVLHFLPKGDIHYVNTRFSY